MKKLTEQHKKNIGAAHIGKKHSLLSILKRTGKNHFRWKGNKVGYRAIHLWIERNYGKSKFCEDCFSVNFKQRYYHWANISGKYKRERSDWKRLCLYCHRKFDKIKRQCLKS